MTAISRATLKLTWDGKAVKERVRAAEVAAVQRTMARAAAWAKYDHEYLDRTGEMTASITILDPAHVRPGGVSGSWGSVMNYSLYLEIGTSRKESGAPTAPERAEAADGHMWAIAPPQPAGPHTDTYWYSVDGERFKVPGDGPLMSPRMWGRPAAAREYPLLGLRVKAALLGVEMP